MKKKIGILGKGNVGGALARGLERAGYEVRTTGRPASELRDVAAWADVVVLAVPYGAVAEVAEAVGDVVRHKTVIDATNALDAKMGLAVGFSTSGAEELQRRLPEARVVKAFNTVFAQHLDTGKVSGSELTAFVASDDADAKATGVELAGAIGFQPVDAGPLANARLLEPLALLNIQLGYVLGLGTQIGIALVQERRP